MDLPKKERMVHKLNFPHVSQARDAFDLHLTNAGVEWSKLPTRTCPSLGLSSIIVLLASFGDILAFVAAMTPLAILLSLLLKWLLKLVGRKDGGMLSKWEEIPWSLVEHLSISYIILSYGLGTIALFDIVTPRKREPWMWKDTWADKRLDDLFSMWQ